jgi:hypothetical protein
VFRQQWQAQAASLAKKVGALKRACDALKSSEDLIGVLTTVLSVGNLLNKGTRRGGSKGFTIQSLAKLVSVKAADGSSLLDYIASVYVKKKQTSTGVEDAAPAPRSSSSSSSRGGGGRGRGRTGAGLVVPELALAASVATSDLASDLRSLQRGLAELQAELAAEPPRDTHDWRAFDVTCASTVGTIATLERETQASIVAALAFFKADEESIGEFLPRMHAFIVDFNRACAKQQRA